MSWGASRILSVPKTRSALALFSKAPRLWHNTWPTAGTQGMAVGRVNKREMETDLTWALELGDLVPA